MIGVNIFLSSVTINFPRKEVPWIEVLTYISHLFPAL
jgi:hypothetical protein